MTQTAIESNRRASDPMEVVEFVLTSRELPFDRTMDDAIVAEGLTHWCELKLWCLWREDEGALLFAWHFGARVPDKLHPAIYELLARVNERLLLGHFAFSQEECAVYFRQTLLMAGAESLSSEQVENFMDTAIVECERFYPALQSLIWGGRTPKEALEIAVFDTIGEA